MPRPDLHRFSSARSARRLQEIEQKLGKKVIRENGPRIIDLDLLLYGDETLNLPNCNSPTQAFYNATSSYAPFTTSTPPSPIPVGRKKQLETALADLGQSYLLEDSQALEDPNL